MRATSVTVGIPVGDLAAARAWYDRVLGAPPALEPVPGIIEYEVAGTWLQLGADRWVLRYGVEDLEAERRRLRGLGVELGEVATVPGVIRYFDFRDPDGNELSCYQEIEPDADPPPS